MANAEDTHMDTRYKITWRDFCLICFSGFAILIDYGFDIYLAMTFKAHGEEIYFRLTLAFLVIPSAIMSAQSLIGYYRDERSKVYPKIPVSRWITLSIFHLLQLAPIWRCAETLIIGNRFTKKTKKNESMKEEQENLEKQGTREELANLEKRFHRAHYRLSSLKLLEAFLEGCPQLVLQTYILINAHSTSHIEPTSSTILTTTSTTSSYSTSNTTSPITPTSFTHDEKKEELIKISIKIGISLISVAMTMMSYQDKKSWDEPHRRELHKHGAALEFLWYLFTLLSRLVALAVLALLHVKACIIVVFIHWLSMFLWVQHYKHKIKDKDNTIIHNIAIGGVFIFSIVKEFKNSMKQHHAVYYFIVFCEGLITMVVWYKRNRPECMVLTSLFLGSFVLGIAFMKLHYRWYNLHKPKPDPNSSPDSEK